MENDLKAALNDRGVSTPQRGASLEDLRKYRTELTKLANNPDLKRLNIQINIEHDRVTRNINQRDWLKKHKGQTITPKLKDKEVAMLDWIALQIVKKSSMEDEISEKKKGRLLAGRSGALRHLINNYHDEMLEKRGDDFRKEIDILTKNSDHMKNFWRSYASYKNRNLRQGPSLPSSVAGIIYNDD